MRKEYIGRSPSEEREHRYTTKALHKQVIDQYREYAALKDATNCEVIRSKFPVLTNVFDTIDKGVRLYESFKPQADN